MKKKVIAILLTTILLLSIGSTAYASSGSWQNDGYGWWYAYDGGGYAANQWDYIDGYWYHFNGSGYMDTGWLYDGAWYYLNPDGSMATGWIYDDAWYYMDPSSGAMKTGWIYDGAWYYMDPSSGAMKTGWINDGNNWYNSNANGAMQTGWFWDVAWYYLYPSGIMTTGWVYDNGNKYYFDETPGVMVTGEVDIDGEIHTTTPSTNTGNVLSAADKAAKDTLNKVGWDLYAAYKWSVNASYNKVITGAIVSSAALAIFQNGAGDSAAKASAFCLMARILGYDACVCFGEVPSGMGGYERHAWVEIVVGGKTYVCDPDFETQTGINGYMLDDNPLGIIDFRYFPE